MCATKNPHLIENCYSNPQPKNTNSGRGGACLRPPPGAPPKIHTSLRIAIRRRWASRISFGWRSSLQLWQPQSRPKCARQQHQPIANQPLKGVAAGGFGVSNRCSCCFHSSLSYHEAGKGRTRKEESRIGKQSRKQKAKARTPIAHCPQSTGGKVSRPSPNAWERGWG